jgi:excisionase family DNA binding protein
MFEDVRHVHDARDVSRVNILTPFVASEPAARKRICPAAKAATVRYTVPEVTTTVERKTVSITKACELVCVSRRTIYNWLSSGKLEYVRTAGGAVRIFADTLWRDPHRTDRPAIEAVWEVNDRTRA